MKKVLFVFSLLTILSSCFVDDTQNVQGEQVVNIYTDRHYDIDDVIFEKFTKETGIKVNVVEGKASDLLQRIELEGDSTRADIFFTSDVGRLVQADQKGIFGSVTSPILDENIPSHLKSSEGKWFGLTKRARIIVYRKDSISPDDLSTYEDLTKPKWAGRIAIRQSNNVYNQSLLASIIAANGEDSAARWVKGVVANMYQDPSGNDRDQVKAIYAGKADVAVVNTYYIGKMLNSENELEVKAGESVGVFYPNQNGRGAHINVSGAGVTKNSSNKVNAIKFIEFLSGEEVQGEFDEANYEFPVNPKVSPSGVVTSWGEFKEDTVPLETIGENNSKAIELFDKGGWK